MKKQEMTGPSGVGHADVHSEEHGHARVYEPAPVDGGTLSAENRHYLERVLRVRPGDGFQITDGNGSEGMALLRASGTYGLGELREMGREPAIEVTLFVALIKGDRFEMVLEKAVELGARRIVPVVASRCVARPPAAGKFERWRKIALAAMLQCGGCRLPVVADPVAMHDLPHPESGVHALLLHEEPVNEALQGGDAARTREGAFSRNEDPDSAKNVRQGNVLAGLADDGRGVALPRGEVPQIWVMSGPEGGFSDEEVASLVRGGWRATWLGPRRLRADTAPIAALAALVSSPFFGPATRVVAQKVR